jgi:hypothetical protein
VGHRQSPRPTHHRLTLRRALQWGTYGQAADKEEIDVFTFE